MWFGEALLILLGVVAIALLVPWLVRRELGDRFEKWNSEIKGGYAAIASEQQGRATEAERQRESYKDLLGQWTERIASISESLNRIDKEAIGRVEDMSGMLKPIISIFRSPQAAGIEFGEAELEMLLRSHLGEGLYAIKPRNLALGQDVVDFALRLPDCMVPIDSKFPSASYRAWIEAEDEPAGKAAWRAFRDEVLRQMEATSKYIKPDSGTTDYALLFVPSDVIYQQAFLTQRMYDQDNPIPKRSQELQVFGCSPQSLMPMFGLIRLGLRNLKIAEDVRGIREQIEQLEALSRGFGSDWKILRGHIDRLASHADKVSSGRGSLSRLSEAIARLAHPTEGAPSSASQENEVAERALEEVNHE